MVSIGTKVYGMKVKVSEDAEVKPTYYEVVQDMGSPPPSGQELDFLVYVKQKLETEQAVEVNYAEVSGNTLTVQWRPLGSPISVGIIAALIVAAIIVWGLVSLASTTYQIIQILGPETSGMIFQIFAFFFFLMMMSMMMSMFTGVFRR